jgi:hypothetical protein
MHFSAIFPMLSGLAMLSTSAAAPNSLAARADGTATFQTFTVPTCDREDGTQRYQDITSGACRPLMGAPAQSIRVYFTSNQANCQGKPSVDVLPLSKPADLESVNTFSGTGCTGDLTSYKFENNNAPCRLINNKVSYNVTC